MAEEPKRDIQARLRDLGLQFMESLVPLSHLAESSKDTVDCKATCKYENVLQLSLVYAATS